MSKQQIIIGILLIAAIILYNPASAGGIGISPTTISVSEGMRGETYEKTVTIFNPDSEELYFVLETEDEAGDWITFSDYDSNTPLTEGIISPYGKQSILVTISVPPDAANGIYNATIYASTQSEGISGKIGTQSVFRTTCHMTIKVTDIQRLSGIVEYISVLDGEVNQPLPIEIKFSNTGNVVAKPSITIVMEKDGITTDQVTVNNAEVDRSSSKIIQTDWDTTGQKTGKYNAKISVSLDGSLLKRENIPFELFPVGTLTQEGEFVTLTSDGNLHPGTLLKVIGTFRNTGDMGTTTKMVGEVIKNGNLIETIESNELLVPAHQSKQLTSYLDIPDIGDYVITAHMIYAGKETDEKELTFTVSEASYEPDVSEPSDAIQVKVPQDTRTPLSIISVTSAVLIAGLFFMAMRKKE